jgi:hypothetical protein
MWEVATAAVGRARLTRGQCLINRPIARRGSTFSEPDPLPGRRQTEPAVLGRVESQVRSKRRSHPPLQRNAVCFHAQVTSPTRLKSLESAARRDHYIAPTPSCGWPRDGPARPPPPSYARNRPEAVGILVRGRPSGEQSGRVCGAAAHTPPSPGGDARGMDARRSQCPLTPPSYARNRRHAVGDWPTREAASV